MNPRKCPKCGKNMTIVRRLPYLNNNTFFYECNYCFYISELMTDNNKPFGENYSDLPDCDKSIKDWEDNKKWNVIGILKEKHKINQKRFKKITRDDYDNFVIDLYLFNKKLEKVLKKKKKKSVKKTIRKKKGTKNDKPKK